jgi:GNAT superfamily N-acetyltransferase
VNEKRAAEGRMLLPARVTPHTLRRTFASLCFFAGRDLRWVMGQLGHDNPRMTLAVYAQCMKRQRIDRDLVWALMRSRMRTRDASRNEAGEQADRRAAGIRRDSAGSAVPTARGSSSSSVCLFASPRSAPSLSASAAATLSDVHIRAAEPGDRAELEGFLERWHSLRVARLGTLERPLDHAMLVAERDGRLIGVLTYVVRGGDCEVLTLHADERRNGVGSALIADVKQIARRAGCNRLWLITTNDNVDALRFYQRRGFRLAALHPGAVDASRTRLKPEIAEVGDHGIPIRDELELEQAIGGAPQTSGRAASTNVQGPVPRVCEERARGGPSSCCTWTGPESKDGGSQWKCAARRAAPIQPHPRADEARET